MIRERIEERLARVAVSTHLGVPVKRFEDGKASGQVDALIEQGTDYPLEVVSAHDVQGLQLLAATKRYGPVIDAGLSHHWYVRLRPTARMREIHRIILKSLPAPESAVVLGGVDPPDSLGRLGVRSVSAAPAPEGNGSVWFMYPVNFGSGGTDELGEWASAYLASQPDVAEKLGRHGGDQRHAFVWMGHNAFPPAEMQLSSGGFSPMAAPTLPPEITHLWVGSLLSGRQVWYWSPSGSWEATGWWTPIEP